MISAKKLSGLVLATAAAAMFATTPAAVAGEKSEGTIHCQGVNACKGKTGCATASNSCKGQNSCKGKGWVATSKEACEAIGGKAKDAKAKN